MTSTVSGTPVATIQAHLPFELASARTARRLLNQVFADLEVTQLLAEDAGLVVHELVTNSVTHGSPSSHDAVEITCTVFDAVVELSVLDGGCDGQISARELTVDQDGGRGLPMVDTVAESWSIERSAGTLVTARLCA